MYLTRPLLGAFTLLLAHATSAADGQVLDLTPATFDTEINAGTPALVEFFAPWCGHCKRLEPVYEELAKSFAASIPSKVKIAKVNADEHKDLGKRFDVKGFPTLKWFDGTGGKPEEYSGGRELEDLQDFIQKKLSIRPRRAPKPPTDIKHLTDQDFEKVVGKDKDVIVAFTAPWCGHCKTLAPIWEKLATDMKPDDETVLVAKVDAEANPKIARDQTVESYPTIKYFPAGAPLEKPLKYEGARDEKSFLEYINEQAGTARVVGGGLSLAAGTVEKLDEIVARVNLAGEDLAGLTDEAKKAAADLGKSIKTKYSEYYLRVLAKLKDNQGYLEKETGRLEGLLKKGGLAREKEDDLTSRLNVLKKFGIGSGKDEL